MLPSAANTKALPGRQGIVAPGKSSRIVCVRASMIKVLPTTPHKNDTLNYNMSMKMMLGCKQVGLRCSQSTGDVRQPTIQAVDWFVPEPGRFCSGLFATWKPWHQNLMMLGYKCPRLLRTSPVDLAKPWEHLKPTCFAAARSSNMSLHTPSGHIVAPKSGLFACHHHRVVFQVLSAFDHGGTQTAFGGQLGVWRLMLLLLAANKQCAAAWQVGFRWLSRP